MKRKSKEKVKKQKKAIFILISIIGISVSTAYHANLAHRMVVAPKDEQQIVQWANQDGTGCERVDGAWVCKALKSATKPVVVNMRQKTAIKTVTAYNSVPEQTDGSPCIAAYNDNICELEKKGDHSCAAAYPYGTKLTIPSKGTCTVRDVLAPKYANRVDWYEGGRDKIADAKAWGIRNLQVSIAYES